jgi:hypothetical protein
VRKMLLLTHLTSAALASILEFALCPANSSACASRLDLWNVAIRSAVLCNSRSGVPQTLACGEPLVPLSPNPLPSLIGPVCNTPRLGLSCSPVCQGGLPRALTSKQLKLLLPESMSPPVGLVRSTLRPDFSYALACRNSLPQALIASEQPIHLLLAPQPPSALLACSMSLIGLPCSAEWQSCFPKCLFLNSQHFYFQCLRFTTNQVGAYLAIASLARATGLYFAPCHIYYNATY